MSVDDISALLDKVVVQNILVSCAIGLGSGTVIAGVTFIILQKFNKEKIL